MISVFDGGPPPACPTPYNLAADVLTGAGAHPDKPALVILNETGAETWSYARLEAAVRATGTALHARGLVPGDRVLMRLGNEVEFPLLFLGAIAAGLVPVPTSAQLTAPEVTKMAAQVRPALVVAGAGIAVPEDPGCPVISSGDLAWSGAASAYEMDAPDRLAYLIFTSGTSGGARAVAHAHRAVRARRMMWDGWYGLRADDRLMHAGAFNWTYTLGTGLLDPWAAGATALIPGPGVGVDRLADLLREHGATLFAAAPGVYRQMLRGRPTIDLPALRHALSAGEALPKATRDAWQAATGTPVHEALGMSECSTFISGSPARPSPEGTCGYPQPGRHIAVLDGNGTPVPHGVLGTLAIHRSDPGLFLGYFGDDAETKAKFIGDWFLTGDTVTMAADGVITYAGRNDDMMNAGGFRVSPLDVESELAQYPGLIDFAVTEIRVKADTTVIAAFYVAPEPIDKRLLEHFAVQRLARYKQPRLYIAVPAIPRNANGKINRRILRETYEAHDDQA